MLKASLQTGRLPACRRRLYHTAVLSFGAGSQVYTAADHCVGRRCLFRRFLSLTYSKQVLPAACRALWAATHLATTMRLKRPSYPKTFRKLPLDITIAWLLMLRVSYGAGGKLLHAIACWDKLP